MAHPTLRDLVLAALPQTQCTRCGFPDCAAYARAIAEDQAPLNQCPPGGQEGIERLSRITGQTALPLSPDHGVELAFHGQQGRAGDVLRTNAL